MPDNLIDGQSALVQVMTWPSGNKPLPNQMVIQISLLL